MTDEAQKPDDSKKQELPPDPVADDIFDSLTSYRRLGQTYIAVLAGIPAVTLLSSLVRAPGESGFDERTLAAGLVAIALALGLGMALVAWVRAPVEIRDADEDLQHFDMARILGARNPDYTSLIAQIRLITRTPDISPQSKEALKAAMRVRQRVYQLVAADRMKAKVGGVVTITLFAVALAIATLGVFLLATAPNPKASSAAPVQLVTVTLTPAGQQALGCKAKTFTALQVGGDATAPIVVPSDTTCTAGKLLTLTVGAPEKFASKVEPIEAAADEPPDTTTTDTTGTTPADTTDLTPTDATATTP